MIEKARFAIADYVVFGLMLAISAGIGIFHAITGGRQKSTQEFLMANRSMNFLPVALSVLASFFSASTLLGTPAEIYQFGTMYWISVFSAVMAPITGAFLFGPMFFRLKVLSVFEYLEMRFKSRSIRLFGAFLFVLRAVIGMGIVLYGPSTALSAVTDFPVWAIIIMVGVVCTFYTAIGGMKAVIWTDVFQTVIMLAGMLAVLIQACIKVGGISEVWRICEEGGRISFFDFNTDPHIRHTFWTLIVGIYFVWLPPYTVDQQMVQRFSSTKSLKHAKWALLCNVPGMFILITLCSVTGLTLYAYYTECDPLKDKKISNPNQLLPFFVLDILGHLPGLPGLFVASLFSGALSSVSSMLNSLAAVTWEDFLKIRYSHISDSKATAITKVLALCYGCVGVGLAFLVAQLGGTVLQASLTLNGAIGAPLVGIFILGAFFTSTNWIGTLVGGVCGLAFALWLSVGAYLTTPLDFKLPTSTDGCNVTANISVTMATMMSTMATNMTTTTLSPSDPARLHGLEKLYGLSYLWFSALGILTTVFVGLFVSYATGATDPKDVDDNLQLKLFQRFFSCLCFPPSLDEKEIQMEKVKKDLEKETSFTTWSISVSLEPGIHGSYSVCRVIISHVGSNLREKHIIAPDADLLALV
ncbi:sodium-coupled monocarboxylate transporter 1-like [Gigantopelta aegis]|uniref:sodium-coupled monocarboxylate transporter 1-like n=1 Tax=Gigantopelta aegis TaxID=1735272 RepID=UPI001B88BCE1|nr:sodium-coupled monocarboxylate transporter 1-like [Gigantopelta aegis]